MEIDYYLIIKYQIYIALISNKCSESLNIDDEYQ